MARSQISAQLGREDGWMISHQSPAYPHRNQKAVLILNLQDGVAYTTFLNGLLLGKFKLFLIKSKVTTLADVGEDNDSQSNKLPRKD